MRGLGRAFAQARAGLRLRARRTLLTALGIALSGAMLGAAIVVGVGLGQGFDRAARAADLPDVIARFDPESEASVVARVQALPDLAGYATRFEATNAGIRVGGRERDDAVAEVVQPGPRRGYAVVAGRDLSRRTPEVLVERAFADAWRLRPGSSVFVDGLGRQRVVGLVEAPDNVGFPLAKPRFYVSRAAIDARFGAERTPQVNVVEIWLRRPEYLTEVLAQARATSFGLHNLRFATRSGVHVLLDQAAGIVIDLLVALAVIALLTAGVMLGASARTEVQRRIGAIGVRRAVGATREHEVLSLSLEAALIAAPAATLGVAAGVLAVSAPATRLLTLLNEPPPGPELVVPLLAGWLASIAIPVAATAWPAWRVGSRPVVALLRGAEVSPTTSARGRGGGLAVLGARLVGARRARMAATVVTLAVSTGFALLLLALASALSTLETDPGALGKRYQLVASLPPAATARVRAIAGVRDAAPRYEVQAADSYSLGETIDVIAYPGDHTSFEAPALLSGRRLAGRHEAEVGSGLAQALGLQPGSTLALALPSGKEVRLRVSGVVSSLDHDGRVAFIPAAALLAADPSALSSIVVSLQPGADQAAVNSALTALGAAPAPAGTATARGAPLVAVLRAILTAVAVVDGLVCLYALIQTAALTVQERRRTLAILRACGAASPAVRRLLAGAMLALILPAAVLGVLLERLVLGPALAHLAAGYAALPLGASAHQVAAALGALALAGAVAVVWVERHAAREPVVMGLAAG